MRDIGDYAMVGDLETAAMIGRDGSVDWLCVPRFDSGAVFARLLDDEDAGHWTIAPDGSTTSTSRRYRDETLVLETTWETNDGTVRVLDFMPPRGEAADLVRIVEGVSGRVAVSSVMRLRFDYGRMRPWVRGQDGEIAAVAGPDAVWLRTPLHVDHHDDVLEARFTVGEGDRVPFVLTYQRSHLPPPTMAEAEQALKDTVRFWTDWIGRCRYDGPWSEAVRTSLMVLKALTYAPTGGIVAAATSSLPEVMGGVRNWDYRYCWLRDATFTLQALLGTGYDDEAKAWREWLIRAVAGEPAKLQIMYAVDGTARLPESEVDWLSGFEGSQPVRIGNAASEQFQLDVYGEILDGLHLARELGMKVTEPAWEVQRSLLDWLEGNWREPDNGLWEMRGQRQPFVHSKVMAWAGVDRAVHTVDEHGLDGPVDRWRRLREEIHKEVCDKGFDSDRGTFTQYYGSKALDAALLLIPRVGFLPWDDERVVGTVEAVQRELSWDGLLLRYSQDEDSSDGLPGKEGTFIACSFWLADALHGMGREKEARALFERLLGLRNDVGLLTEEYDPDNGRLLGNTPQAFSMVGLVNSARQLSGTPISTAEPAPRQLR